ncbi:MAG: zinc-dependent peptidase [Alcanivorax sp.]|nr:zinc-dependent peptidase [Alcanivorax sp.]
MLAAWRRWRERRRVEKMGFTAQQWEAAVADWPVAARYQGAQRDALQALTFRFLARKSVASGGGFAITDAMCLKLATMACVPILNLGLHWYDGWYTVILYEGAFIPNRPYRSDDGIVHPRGPVLSGEAWLRGPVVLSWEAICHAGGAGNVVIHEMAHKLDMRHQGANGAPPLHAGMSPAQWHDTFTDCWQALQDDYRHHRHMPVNAYALTGPGEFFAVCSEAFFESPQQLHHDWPELYRLLAQFYRQGERP